MKDFKNWGLKVRRDQTRNYYSVWENLETVRLDLGNEIKLPYGESEFYDIGITEKCNAMCDFCYVSADSGKQDYKDICETWKSWMNSFPEDTPIDIKSDPVFKDIISTPDKTNTLEEVKFKLKVLWFIKNKLPLVYTKKPFQIAIGI